jgi:DNA-binding HxlR family transcriptional regulator
VTLVSADDALITLLVGVTTSAIIILGFTLARYRSAVSEAGRSSQLAKNLWDAMNTRLAVQDTRIIDLMAKVEVYSTRKAGTVSKMVLPKEVVVSQSSTVNQKSPTTPQVNTVPSRQTEVQILESLNSGAKTSGQIRDIIGKSREHTARLMKELYEKGLVVRREGERPFSYEVTDEGKRYLSAA